MLWVLLIAFFSADHSSKMPPDFPFIGTETSDFSEGTREWADIGTERGGRSNCVVGTMSWVWIAKLHPPENSQLLSIWDGGHSNYSPPSAKIQSTGPPPLSCTQAHPTTRSGEPKPWHHHQWLSLTQCTLSSSSVPFIITLSLNVFLVSFSSVILSLFSVLSHLGFALVFWCSSLRSVVRH